MKIRLKATEYIWVAYAVSMIAIFGSTVFTRQPLGSGHVIVGIALSIMAFLSTGTVWNWGNLPPQAFDEETSNAKRKNQRQLDAILERLSDEEREALRERLTAESGRYALSDDGELVGYP